MGEYCVNLIKKIRLYNWFSENSRGESMIGRSKAQCNNRSIVF